MSFSFANEFPLSEDHPLKKYILSIDENLEDDSMLRTIGERIGIYIPNNEFSPYILYIKLKEYLENETDHEKTRYIINLLPEEYEKYMNLNEDIFYYDRLNNFKF